MTVVLPSNHDVLVPAVSVQRGGADLRAGDRGGLLAVLDVLMAGDFGAGALRDSKTTMSVLSAMARESKVKVTSTSPLAVSGVKVVSAVTGSPSTSGPPLRLPSLSDFFTCMEPFRCTPCQG